MLPARRLILFSAAVFAALTAVLAIILPAGIASAASRPAAGNRVWAFSPAAQVHAGADRGIPAGQRLGEVVSCPVCPSGTCVAPEAAGIPAGSTADAATSGGHITPSVRGQYFQDGAAPPTCSYCQQNPAAHLDHVIPRSQGGDLSPDNLTPACSWCNLSKGARVAPVNPPPGFIGEWPPSFWPSRMFDWWNSTYGGV